LTLGSQLEMPVKKVFLILLMCAGCHAGTTPAVAPMNPADAQVRAVVQRYLHGLKFNQVDDFKAAFWPDAKLLFVKKDGTLGQLTQDQGYEGFATVAGKEEEGALRVFAVDITGDAASVKVEEIYPKSVYIDYLNLLRIAGEWRIVNKIYTSYPR
jgi:hypothetical protein